MSIECRFIPPSKFSKSEQLVRRGYVYLVVAISYSGITLKSHPVQLSPLINLSRTQTETTIDRGSNYLDQVMLKQQNSVIYISHGGGPLPLLGDTAHQPLIDTLRSISNSIAKPEAIVIFSAHWETQNIKITGGAQPPLIYDYFGFPESSYSIQYPAKGHPQLAREIKEKIAEHGLPVSIDPDRGFDHGMFVPLKLMYPKADIPCVQISLSRRLDPDLHIRLGQSLSSLKDRNILFIGSGSSFHNLGNFFNPSSEDKQRNDEFHRWLNHTMSDPALSEITRQDELINWKDAPHSGFCHPREEHLIPLHICYGLAGKEAEQVYTSELFGMQLSCYRWS